MSDTPIMFSNYTSENNQVSFEFSLSDKYSQITSVIGNTIRRVLISEIPTVSFEDDSKKHFGFLEPLDKAPKQILIRKNRSNLHNEFIAHRLSLLPIHFQENNQIQIVSKFEESIGKRIYYLLNAETLPYFSLQIKNNK